MMPDFQKAHIAGVERIAAWSDVLDVINVFPVADGDTGRNLITRFLCQPCPGCKIRQRPGLAGRQQADARNDADRFGYIG